MDVFGGLAELDLELSVQTVGGQYEVAGASAEVVGGDGLLLYFLIVGVVESHLHLSIADSVAFVVLLGIDESGDVNGLSWAIDGSVGIDAVADFLLAFLDAVGHRVGGIHVGGGIGGRELCLHLMGLDADMRLTLCIGLIGLCLGFPFVLHTLFPRADDFAALYRLPCDGIDHAGDISFLWQGYAGELERGETHAVIVAG